MCVPVSFLEVAVVRNIAQFCHYRRIKSIRYACHCPLAVTLACILCSSPGILT